MARRSVRVLALAALAGALGCQDYNFNPVGHCLIQPGTKRVTLSSVASADILFVVDDSGSMAGEQTNLASNFGAFVNALTAANDQRIAAGLEPIDFHIAITTSSVFYNPQVATCSSSCGVGGLVCCQNGVPEQQVRRCAGGGACGSGNSCRPDCAGYRDEQVCCSAAGAAPEKYVVTCTAAGTPCGDLRTRFEQACTPSPASSGVTHAIGDKFPQGDFVAATGNPKVIHFDAALYKEPEPQRTSDIQARVVQFQANVHVGTCGSGQEQHLQAGRLAVQKALAGQQKEADGATAAQWPHANSKMVVVFVGDEDDCSSPQDPVQGVVFSLTGVPGNDSCTADVDTNGNPIKRFKTSDFVSYLASVRQPGLLGAGVVASAGDGTCHADPNTGLDVCQPGICCDTVCTGNANVCTSQTCGGQGAGSRLFDFGTRVSATGSEVVEGSICADFSGVLDQLAQIVKPPSVLKLPTSPASDQVFVLRIATASGVTRTICGNGAPVGAQTPASYQAAVDAGYQWWFTASDLGVPDPSSVATRYVFINHGAGTCEANPGETYSADYLGRLPDSGCMSVTDCSDALGSPGAWNCCLSVDAQGNCAAPTDPTNPGTCLCKGTTG